MNRLTLIIGFLSSILAYAQLRVDMAAYIKQKGTEVVSHNDQVSVSWPASGNQKARLVIDLRPDAPLFNSLQLTRQGKYQEIARAIDPAFVLTIGKRDLVSQNGWNIFFDKTNKLPHKAYAVTLTKRSASVRSEGARTVIRVGDVQAATFSGAIEITVYNGSPLFNVAAVMATEVDSTAILYDAGMVSKQPIWKTIAWADTDNRMQQIPADITQLNRAQGVKYRTIIGSNPTGSMAVFPAPHQYFYPLDEAFNLDFTWYGTHYRSLIPDFGIGIRQDLMGDKRWVPWINAPPKTQQRLNFFCLLSTDAPTPTLEDVKKFTHNDTYPTLAGYKTMSSHFHNEFVMNVLLANKPVPETPSFVKVFKNTGIDIVHLAEFHYTAHPKGPDEQRLLELKTLHDMCQRWSDKALSAVAGRRTQRVFWWALAELFPEAGVLDHGPPARHALCNRRPALRQGVPHCR